MNLSAKVLLGASTLLLTSFSVKAETLRIRLGGEVYRGQSTIQLRRLIKNQYPGINLQNRKLREVTLIAKSKMGHGEASLSVGHRTTRRYGIDGRPYEFRSNQRHSFYRVSLNNPSYSSQGRWIVNLRGAVKVRSIQVRLSDRPHRRPSRPSRPSRISASCNLDIGGNFLRPKTNVKCNISGQGAVSYKILVNGYSKWSGQLNSRNSRNSFRTDKKKVGGYSSNYQLVIFDRSGRQHRMYIR